MTRQGAIESDQDACAPYATAEGELHNTRPRGEQYWYIDPQSGRWAMSTPGPGSAEGLTEYDEVPAPAREALSRAAGW